MQPGDNSQFTEEQRTEAYRQVHMAHVERQTKALEKINGTLTFFLVLFLGGIVLWLLLAIFANR